MRRRVSANRAPARSPTKSHWQAGDRPTRRGDLRVGSFTAMAGPCEILVEIDPIDSAAHLLEIARQETKRIEAKFSRYRNGNIVHEIHTSGGQPVDVDDETAALLDFADHCFHLSEGRFDITSGVLRRVWRFDGTDRLPSAEDVEAVRPKIGWEKVDWSRPSLCLPEGMELDLGGIGKEYAVDRVCALLSEETQAPFLVNFGGDLRASGPQAGGRPWRVGIDDPRAEGTPVRRVDLSRGALATSGDARRFLEKDGVRYPHVLDPRTGWPVTEAPRSVTIAAPTCTEAGMIATFAMLRGSDAESFLESEGVRYWCVR